MCDISKTVTKKTVFYDYSGNKIDETEGFVVPKIDIYKDYIPMTIKHIRITEEVVNVMYVERKE